MINDSMQQCRFCSVPLDPAVVELTAERQEKANQAYSDASFLKTAAIAMLVFVGLSLIPFLPFVYWGFLGIFIVVLILLIRWQVKFGSLLTSDADYKLAKRSRNIALVLWLVAIPLGFIIRPLLELIVARLL
jgi:fatty acid desaturase